MSDKLKCVVCSVIWWFLISTYAYTCWLFHAAQNKTLITICNLGTVETKIEFCLTNLTKHYFGLRKLVAFYLSQSTRVLEHVYARVKHFKSVWNQVNVSRRYKSRLFKYFWMISKNIIKYLIFKQVNNKLIAFWCRLHEWKKKYVSQASET